MSENAVTAGQQLLSAQHAAIFSYGLIGARLPDDEQQQAAAALAGHRAARDEVIVTLRELGAEPQPAAAAYDTGVVDTGEQARQLAASVETSLVPRWAQWAGTQEGAQRGYANTQAQSCALRAIAWGATASAFPGRA